MNTVRRSLFVGLVVLAGATPALAGPLAREADFEKLHALIKPGKGEEPWATIPWLTDLWRARQLAAREGKPILLWEMDGHPLGCT